MVEQLLIVDSELNVEVAQQPGNKRSTGSSAVAPMQLIHLVDSQQAHKHFHQLLLTIEERNHLANIVVIEDIGPHALRKSFFILISIHNSLRKKVLLPRNTTLAHAQWFMQN